MIVSGFGGSDSAAVILLWDLVPAVFVLRLFLVLAVPILLWGLVPAISGSGGSDPVVGSCFDSDFGSGCPGPVVGPGFDSVSVSGGPDSAMGPCSGPVFGSGGSDSLSGSGGLGSVLEKQF